MKKLNLLFAILVIGLHAGAQNFEGTIKWSMETNIKDAATKEQMAKAKQMQSDPAMQEQMKKMKEQMNDPQMKAMMDSNPQLKAQMEKMMKMTQSGDMSSMFPTGFEIKIKNSNTLTKIEGGMMQGEVLYLHDADKRYQIDRENKTYQLQSTGNYEAPTKPDYKVTKTSETKKILGYTCTKYLISQEQHGKKVMSTIWATNEIKGLSASNFDQGAGSRDKMFFKEIDGVPLRMEMNSEEADIIMEVVDLKKESLSDSLFKLPSDYTEVKSQFGN